MLFEEVSFALPSVVFKERRRLTDLFDPVRPVVLTFGKVIGLLGLRACGLIEDCIEVVVQLVELGVVIELALGNLMLEVVHLRQLVLVVAMLVEQFHLSSAVDNLQA